MEETPQYQINSVKKLFLCKKLFVCLIDNEYGSWSSRKEKEWLDRTKMIAQIIIDRFEQFATPIYGQTECILLAEPLIKPKVICLMDILRENMTGKV